MCKIRMRGVATGGSSWSWRHRRLNHIIVSGGVSQWGKLKIDKRWIQICISKWCWRCEKGHDCVYRTQPRRRMVAPSDLWKCSCWICGWILSLGNVLRFHCSGTLTVVVAMTGGLKLKGYDWGLILACLKDETEDWISWSAIFTKKKQGKLKTTLNQSMYLGV